MEESNASYLDSQQNQQRSTILRVYNYYRILISFLFLFLFLDPNFNAFIGNVNPDLFRTTIVAYICVNVLIGIATLFVNVQALAKTMPSFVVVIGDIICLTLLMSASGGVISGLGNFLIFTLAFGGGLIHGRVSTVLPAIAFILTIYTEFYLFFLDVNELQNFFQAGMLGIVYFVTNILFQRLSQQLRNRQKEVYTLEQANRLIIEEMRTGVVVVTSDNKARLMNHAAGYLLDRTVSKETIETLPTELVDKVVEWRADSLQKDKNFSSPVTGQTIIATFSALYATSPDADTLVFLEDSTEVQRQAQQLKLAALGRLSASIAHEIRNPLGAISHAAQLIGESKNLDTGDQRLCEIIQNQSVRMNGVIENVLQLSRRKTAEPRPLDIDQWIKDFLLEFTAGFSQAPLIEVDMDIQTSIQADPLHLSQVLSNLLENGLRYSEKNTGELKVKIVGGVNSRTQLPFIEVIDYGEGVKEELRSSLFEPFYTTEATGTGLGLYLSKELCEANNASLIYSQAATGGSSFRITFLK